MKSLENRWEAMVGRMGSESFPDFLRVHWNSRFSFVRQTELFKTIRGKIATRDAVFDLIRQMEEDMDAYMALPQPEASQWSPALKQHATDLRLFSVRQPFPLLMAARRAFADPAFETALRACVIISFRYNVIGSQRTNEQERVYNAVAEKISRKHLTDVTSVLAAMSSVYPGDDAFRAAFSEKSIRTTQSRNKRVVRYILCELEKRLTGTPLDFDSDSFNLEHILPENPEAGWEAFSDDEVEALVYRIGNLTLMSRGANKDLGNAPYTVKKPICAASSYGITKKVAADNAEWAPERLAARQNWMANQATAIWRIDQLA